MLALLGFATIVVFTALVMTKRLSAVAGLVLVPLVFGLLGGFGTDLAGFMMSGISRSAPTGVFLVFALLYFLVMFECGLFEPFIRRILSVVGDDPVRIVMGTAVLIMIAGFDGDGATCALITISSMYPIYRRIGINPLIIAMLLGTINPVLNWMPWGGPAARAAISLKVDLTTIVLPMLPAFFICMAAALVFAYVLGRSEKRRLQKEGALRVQGVGGGNVEAHPGRKVIEPRNFWFNLVLTILLMVGLAMGLVPLPLLAMVAFAIAATVNFPNVDLQQDRLKEYGSTAVLLITLILAAGAFTGVLSKSGMVDAMSTSIVSVIPKDLGWAFSYITALISIPLMIVMSTDSFYLGVLPVLAQTAAAYGIPPESIARAALTAMPAHSLSPLIAPIYFVATLLRTDIGSLQRFAWPWCFGMCFVAAVAGALTGAF